MLFTSTIRVITTKRNTTNNQLHTENSFIMSSRGPNSDGGEERDESMMPKRFIFNDTDLQHFLDSPSKHALLRQVTAMGKSCAGVRTMQYDPNDPLCGLSPAMACLHGALREMHDTWLVDFPPDGTTRARFGNPSFRSWHSRLVQRSASIVHSILQTNAQYPPPGTAVVGYEKDVLAMASTRGVTAAQTTMEIDTVRDEQDRVAITELCAYLRDSFGQPVRLDYGTGHESSFQVFLFALSKIGCFGSTLTEPPPPERLKAITLSIYSAYLAVTRQLQTDYMLEPAGSHGVWGLGTYEGGRGLLCLDWKFSFFVHDKCLAHCFCLLMVFLWDRTHC